MLIKGRGTMTLKLGSHVSMNGKKMLLGASEEALSYGANTRVLELGVF